MPTWIQLFEAHRVSAVSAYGYWDPSSRTPNMSGAFARAMLDGWSQIVVNVLNRDAGPIGTLNEMGGPGLGGTFQGQLGQAAAHLEEDRSLAEGDYVSSPAVIWNHVFSVASILDGGEIAGPSYADSVVETLGDAATAVGDSLAKAARAAAGPIEAGLAIVIAIGLFVAYLELR